MTDPKRRWFQWSLRTLFAIVTVSAIGWKLIEPVAIAKWQEWTAKPPAAGLTSCSLPSCDQDY